MVNTVKYRIYPNKEQKDFFEKQGKLKNHKAFLIFLGENLQC